MHEHETVANWGGLYSTYYTELPNDANTPEARKRIAQQMVNADAVELELAATALFLAYERVPDPWGETARRKPDKAGAGRIERARQLYQQLRQIPTPRPLPAI
jgi:uncharacterized protein